MTKLQVLGRNTFDVSSSESYCCPPKSEGTDLTHFLRETVGGGEKNRFYGRMALKRADWLWQTFTHCTHVSNFNSQLDLGTCCLLATRPGRWILVFPARNVQVCMVDLKVE